MRHVPPCLYLLPVKFVAWNIQLAYFFNSTEFVVNDGFDCLVGIVSRMEDFFNPHNIIFGFSPNGEIGKVREHNIRFTLGFINLNGVEKKFSGKVKQGCQKTVVFSIFTQLSSFAVDRRRAFNFCLTLNKCLIRFFATQGWWGRLT